MATKQITFTSRYPNLRVVVEPQRTQYNTRGDFIGFSDGKAIEFRNGTYVTADEDELAYLRKRIADVDGPHIVELGVTGAPPVEQTLMQLIQISKDRPKVEALLAEERATYERQAVIDACLNILGEEDEAEPEAEAPAEVEAVDEAPTEGDVSPEPDEFDVQNASMADLRARVKFLSPGFNLFQKGREALIEELDRIEKAAV